MGLFQTLLKLIKMASHKLIPKPEILQLHLTDTAVMLLVLCLTSEQNEQTALITKKMLQSCKAVMKTSVHTD